MTLPTEAQDRKTYPIASGVLNYFPDAITTVAHVSYLGNQQHNPGEPLHWAREKSTDHFDCLIRHFMERGTLDSDGQLHSAKMVWRALAILQLEIEAEKEKNERFGKLSNEPKAYIPGGKLAPLKLRTTRSIIGERRRSLKNKKRKINGRTTKARNKNR
jgi:hypothetical protein